MQKINLNWIGIYILANLCDAFRTEYDTVYEKKCETKYETEYETQYETKCETKYETKCEVNVFMRTVESMRYWHPTIFSLN